jgi:hypothetical protein
MAVGRFAMSKPRGKKYGRGFAKIKPRHRQQADLGKDWLRANDPTVDSRGKTRQKAKHTELETSNPVGRRVTARKTSSQ